MTTQLLMLWGLNKNETDSDWFRRRHIKSNKTNF